MDFKRKLVYKHIGARIAYFRALNDMSQDELAHRIHISRGTLSKIERGSYDSSVSLDTLLDIADVFGMEFSMFISSDPEERQYWEKILKNRIKSES
ncbi:MAG: helix-turn-helix transcriptional regulator [Acidaminococcaceae bacterium]|uniref:helix-turn-helix domain-containing protein n=1 Tax=Succiniclasticum sp. TaxID=2775030 RepID=UPI001B098E48|nr:helix-turn-helix transcriptional regulator [Succiniclasticum sp.]MBO5589904.1 helix-turn-helix transcriptional regulator [Acidaminococcaceae bacterium]MBO5636883.1 helix-turn-helix transcriptional regulator [Acidaminococcaceae bacterium]MDY6291004.1 helix-turn-helix transcriptional regulator [Succiniclasticum sp.]